MKFAALLFILDYFLQLLVAKGGGELHCSPAKGANGMEYKVPDFDGQDCYITWSTGTDEMLAACEQPCTHPPQGDVVRFNTTTLCTKKCYEKILYKRSCHSEGIQQTATCNVTCDENPEGPTEATGTEKNQHLGWIVLVPVIAVIAFLVYRWKKESSVNADDVKPYLDDEESSVN